MKNRKAPLCLNTIRLGQTSALAVLVVASSSAYSASFTDVTDAAGLNSIATRGVSFSDYNGDGCLDIMATSATGPSLYKSDCSGGFTEVTDEANIDGPSGTWNGVWADYDADGDLDVYVTTTAEDEVNKFYSNNGDGTFTDIAESAGLGSVLVNKGTLGSAWADYDSDGDLDLWIGSRFSPSNDTSDFLMRNNGNGTFTDVAESAGVKGGSDRLSFQGIWFDYDLDGDQDLYVAVDFGRDTLYANNGDGTFTDVSDSAGITKDPEHGMGISVGDLDNNGCLDVLSSNNTQGIDGQTGQEQGVEHGPSGLYMNNCDGTFTFAPTAYGIGDRGVVEWGLNFVDYDNDTDLDVGIVAGGMLGDGTDNNVLYENDGDAYLTQITASSGAIFTGRSFGSVWADYDNDGDKDWLIAGDDGNTSLFRNDSATGHYLDVKLSGVGQNVNAIGATVWILSGSRVQMRTINAGLSFIGSEPLVAHFGLGVKDKVDAVLVLWPAGGVTWVLDPLTADQMVTIDQNGLVNDNEPTVGNVSGQLTDLFTRQPVASARIDLIQEGTSTPFLTSFSDDQGNYVIANVPAGNYTMTVTAPDYRPATGQNVTVTGGQTSALNVELFPINLPTFN